MAKPSNVDIDWDFDLTIDCYRIRIKKTDAQGHRKGIIILCPESALEDLPGDLSEYFRVYPGSYGWESKRFKSIEYKQDDGKEDTEDIDRTG